MIQASAEIVNLDGDFRDEDLEELDRVLDVLRRNPQVETPVIDMSRLDHLPSKAIGALVALWVDLAREGRWFDLRASDAVMDQLGKIGVASVFMKRPLRP